MTQASEQKRGSGSAEQGRSGKKTARRILAAAAKLGLVAAVLLLAAVTVGWGLLQSEGVRKRLLSYALSKASEHISGQLDAERLEGGFLTGFQLQQVSVSRGKDTVFSVDTLSVRYWLPEIFGDPPRIRSVDLKGLALHLERESDGTWNWERLFPPRPAREPSPGDLAGAAILIRRIRIQDGRVDVIDPEAETLKRISVRDLELDTRLSIGEKFALDLQRLSFAAEPSGAVLKNLRGRVSYRTVDRTILFKELVLQTLGSQAAVEGKLALTGESAALDLVIESPGIDLGEVGRMARIEWLAEGKMSGKLRVSGPLSDLSYEADLSAAPARVQAKGTISGLLSGLPVIALSASVQGLDPAALPLADNPAPSGELNAAVTARFAAAGPIPQGRMTLNLLASHLAGIELRSGTVHAESVGDRLSFVVSDLTTGFGRLRGRGQILGFGQDRNRLSIQADAAVDELDPGRIVADERIEGALSLHFQAEADIPLAGAGREGERPARGHLIGRLTPSRIAGTAIEGGNFDLRLDDGRLRLAPVDFDAAGTSGAAEGEIDFQKRTWDLDLSARIDDIAQFRKKIAPFLSDLDISDPLAGAVTADVRLQGAWKSPRIAASFDGRGLRYGSYRLAQASVDAESAGMPDDQRLRVRLEAAGVDIEERRIDRIEAAATVSPARIEADLTADLTGALRLDAEGSVADWREPVKRITLTKAGLSGEAVSVNNEGPIRLTLYPKGIEIHALTLASGNARLTAAGGITSDRADRLTVGVSALELSWLGRFLPEPLPAEGTASATLTVNGALDAPNIDASLKGVQGRVGSLSPLELDCELSFGEKTLSIDAALRGPLGERASAAGSIPVRLSLRPFSVGWALGELSMTASAKNWRLSALPVPLPGQAQPEGRLNLSARITGTAASPAGVIDATVLDGSVLLPGKAQERFGFSSLALTADCRGGKAAIQAEMKREELVLARLEGALPLTFSLDPAMFSPAPDGLEARIFADGFRASALPIPGRFGVDLDGRLKIDLRLSGALSAPAVNGTLALEEGRLVLPRYGLSYEEASARLRVEKGRLTIEELSLSGDREGRIAADGSIDLEGLQPVRFDLNVSGDNLLVSYRRTLTARVRSSLSLTGRPESPALSGELTILESRLNLDRLSDQGPAEIQVIGETEADSDTVMIGSETDAGSSFLAPLSADIAVAIPRNSWMRGQGLNAEIGGEIRLQKEPGGPFILTGSLSTLRGFYVFQGKRFAINEGTVTFIGLKEPNPNLDIEAETRIQDVQIFIRISGTARNIRLTLDSDPAMDQAEIISYIVFGKSAEDMKTGEAISAEEAAVKMAGQLTTSQLNEIFGDAFIVDTFYIDPGGGDLGQGTISMGKYVTSELFVSYRQSFDIEQLHQLEVTYELTPNLDLETLIGDDKGYGVDLFWKMDY
ncbi:MAG: translocation/assembly module TamB domain-containing protein [Desulfobacterales bacterium]|nr:translocation/assembly module TamB domain-containing protein [Desulfobacterales bacterium]